MNYFKRRPTLDLHDEAGVLRLVLSGVFMTTALARGNSYPPHDLARICVRYADSLIEALSEPDPAAAPEIVP